MEVEKNVDLGRFDPAKIRREIQERLEDELSDAKQRLLKESNGLSTTEIISENSSNGAPNQSRNLVRVLVKEYDQTIKRHLESLLSVSDEDLAKWFANSRQQALDQLHQISEQELIPYETFKQQLNELLDTQEKLHRTDAVTQNLNLQQLYSTALADFHKHIETTVDRWILQFTNLDMKCKYDCISYYNSVINEVVQSCNMDDVSVQHRKQFQAIIESKTDQTFKMLMELQDCLVEYKSYVGKLFEKYQCFSPEKYLEYHQLALEFCTKKLNVRDTQVKKLLLKGIDYYKPQFELRNGIIIGHCKEAAKLAVPRIAKFYNDSMKNFIEDTVLQEEELCNFHKEVVQECLAGLKNACNFHPDSGIPLLEMELQTLLDLESRPHKLSNKQKILNILEITSKSINFHVKIYNKKMDSFMSRQNDQVSELEKFHAAKVKEVCNLLEMDMQIACNSYIDGMYGSFDVILRALNNQIAEEWACLKVLHRTKIKRRALESAQKELEADEKLLELKLQERGSSIRQTAKEHESFLQQEIKLLETEIRGIDGITLSSLDSNLQIPKDKMLEDWDCIKDSNAKKMDEEVQKEKETSREQTKSEVEEKVKEQDELRKRKNESKKPLVNSGEDVLATEQQKSIPIKATTHHAEESNTTLPPIAIEFGLHKIKVGWINNDGDFETIRNSWGEEETLNTVALTLDNEVLIGSEIEHRPKSDLRFHYKLEEILNDPKANDEDYKCNLDGNEYLRKEFLCGIILSRIKLDTEKQLKGNWTTAVITVPLGYTSLQRQATKDSAFIAGFTNVHLINETTAAALALSRLEGRRCSTGGNFFLVTVANDFHLDAAVYSYGLGKVEMISSCGDLHCSQPSNGILKSCLNFDVDSAKRISWYTSSGAETKSPFTAILKNMGEDDRKKIRTMFIDVGSSKDGMENCALKTLTKTHGEPCLYSRPAELIIMGAASFAESLHNFSNESTAKGIFRDKATYGFQRTFGLKSIVTIFEPYQALVATDIRVGQTIVLKSNGGTSIVVEEICGDKIFPWGTISMQVDNSVPEVQINFFLSSESIFHAEAFVMGGKGRKNKVKRVVPVKFYTPTLKHGLKTTYMSLVESLKKDKKKEAFEKSKKGLEDLVGLIESKLDSVKSMIGKSLLEKSIKEALTVIHHHKSTQEMVDIKTAILSGLMSKYIKDKLVAAGIYS